MRYIGTCIGFPWSAVPITDTVKMSISVADISADPIIGTPLITTLQYQRLHEVQNFKY